MLDSEGSLFKDYVQKVNSIEKKELNVFTQQYKRRQILQNILQATQMDKTKLFSAHTEKVMYIHPKIEDNLPKTRIGQTTHLRNSFICKTEQSQEENITIKNQMPINKKFKAIQKQGIKGYQDALSKLTKSYEKPIENNQPSNYELQQLYFTTSSLKIPILPKITERKRHMGQSSQKKNPRNPQIKLELDQQSFCKYLNSDLIISPKPKLQKTVRNFSQEPKPSEQKERALAPQRPVTKRTKVFNQMMQNFNFKDHFVEDNQKDVDDFYNYVRSYKKQK